MFGRDSLFFLIVLSLSLYAIASSSSTIYAQEERHEAGKTLYDKRCSWCHGWSGAGDGPAAQLLNPPPKDFTSASYKFKSSTFDDPFPFDEDIFRSIEEGLPGTSMLGWGDVLSKEDIGHLVAYIKRFIPEWETPSKKIDLSGKIRSSKESIGKGMALFKDRCAGCHGEAGKGTAVMALKDDRGFMTWPRNLTKNWTLRGGDKPADIYMRISAGIPGTMMPSFANSDNNQFMTDEERWHVANYVVSLNDESKMVKEGETVLKAKQVDNILPDEVDDPLWLETERTNFALVPQIIAEKRLFTPTNESVSVRALYNEEEIAFLLEWDDRTKSIPGNKNAQALVHGELHEDAVAIQFPATIQEGAQKPYFGHGDRTNPVNIWLWKSGTAALDSQSLQIIDAKGFKKNSTRESQGILFGDGEYDNGTWRVIMKRSLATIDEKDIQFRPETFIPIAFANWDGSNEEVGPRHTHSTWYWVLLEPSSGIKVFLIPLLFGLLIVGLEIYFSKRFSKEFED